MVYPFSQELAFGLIDFSYKKRNLCMYVYKYIFYFIDFYSSLLIVLSAYTGFYLFFLVSWSGSWGHFFSNIGDLIVVNISLLILML